MSDDVSDNAELELLSLIRSWQDRYDVRPSELVTSLSRIIEIVKPKPSNN